MRIQWRLLLVCLAVPLGVGGVSGWISRGGQAAFAAMNKPPLSPPGWIFPAVWTVLFILMGTASYLVLTSSRSRLGTGRAMGAYGLQLGMNFLWPVLFFNLGNYLLSLVWLLVLWLAILVTAIRFSRISKTAARLLLPYLVWVGFAGYLNWGICLLN